MFASSWIIIVFILLYYTYVYCFQRSIELDSHTEDLPGELFGFNAGFSCKSFSKLHPDWQSMKRAMQEDNDEA